MLINTLEPQNILLLNFYIIPLLQIAFNWSSSDCGTNSNVWQLFFVLTLIVRILIDQLYNNAHISRKLFTILMFITSGVILLTLGIWESYVISTNQEEFTTFCFQNRIVFVSEIILCFLALIKDIIFVGFGMKENEESL